MNLFRFFSLLTVSSSLLSFFGPKRASSSPSFDGKAFDSSVPLNLSDSSVAEIDDYYGNVSGKTGEDLMSYLYTVLSKDNYFLDYGTGFSKNSVGLWYQFTDRNDALSTPIDPATFRFVTKAKSADAATFTLVNMYISKASNDDRKKAYNNAVNGFSKDPSRTDVDYVNGKRPSTNVQVDKEHVWAKNHGFKHVVNGSDQFEKGAPTDLHHLVAADHNTNSAGHNDDYYGDVADHAASTTTTIYAYLADGSKEISGYKGYDAKGKMVFEPTDEWKGDIARCLFYMATRYSKKLEKNTQGEPYLLLTDVKKGEEEPEDSNETYHGYHDNLTTLLKWNELDPVSNYEIHRNNKIYLNVQRNRNPYIDHPEWARRVFDPSYVSDGKELSPQQIHGEEGTNPSNPSSGTSEGSKTETADEGLKLSDIPTYYWIILAAVVVLILILLLVLTSKKRKKRRKVENASSRNYTKKGGSNRKNRRR